MVSTVKAISEGIVRGEIMVIPFLFLYPMEKLES